MNEFFKYQNNLKNNSVVIEKKNPTKYLICFIGVTIKDQAFKPYLAS